MTAQMLVSDGVIAAPPNEVDLVQQIARRKRSRQIQIWTLRTLVLILALVFWQFASGRVFPEFVMSNPSKVALRLATWLHSGYILRNLEVTLKETALGFGVGTLVGCTAGILLGMSRYLSDVSSPYINALYAIPKIMLGPLFVVWFGIEFQMKAFLAALFTVFIVFYNVWSGVQEVDRDLIDTFRLMGASRWALVSGLYIPSALTWLFTSLRLAFPVSLIGAIVGEFIASGEGVGFVVTNAANSYDTAGVFGVIVVVTIAAVIGDQVIVHIQHAVNRRYGREGGRLVI